MINENAKQDLKEGLLLYNTENNVGLKNAWNIIQAEMHCCGVTDYTDWYPVMGDNRVPDRCCMENSQDCGHNSTSLVWKTGCYEKVKMWFDDNKHVLGTIGMCILIIQKMNTSYRTQYILSVKYLHQRLLSSCSCECGSTKLLAADSAVLKTELSKVTERAAAFESAHGGRAPALLPRVPRLVGLCGGSPVDLGAAVYGRAPGYAPVALPWVPAGYGQAFETWPLYLCLWTISVNLQRCGGRYAHVSAPYRDLVTGQQWTKASPVTP
ncbi:tetraspanin-9 isoform X2 [Pelobates cultripes]|uniref:Tetraspanin-9 n=1 Tax=Pelobates cultripes TaxID=61616 RepID=A0AAD1TKP4_PELCU|nr:tetraspanin-9 isoform X2 [Pelobates cultripes]